MIFMNADGVDILLITLGFLGAVGNGACFSIALIVTTKLMNIIGGADTSNSLNFMHNINENVRLLIYIAGAKWITCFLEGFCWTRTAKRKVSRLRIRYLKAVLRQDVGFKASVSDDCLVIQDWIGEKRISRKVRDESNKAGNILEQWISSIRTVYSFVGERKSIEDYCVALEGCVELGVKQSLVKGLFFGSCGFVTAFAITALLSYYGSILVMYNGVHGGNVYMVTLAIFWGGKRLGSGLLNIKDFAEAVAANKRVMEVMKTVPKIDSENMEGQALDNMTGEIEFKRVKFTYPSGPESIGLKDFSLKISRGKTVALVGGSGSAVIALLQRFYNPMAGEILLDGVVINKLQPKWLRYQMSLVSNEPALFATTIKENILFGKEDASMEQVIEAAKASNAHDFICKLPQGYYTKVTCPLTWVQLSSMPYNF
ncbi:hypothetical protein KY285_010086 [Solanum tuberosum]|nr:hypothetical protein KY285_010086 [Solanum tuberosum]